ncbi:peptidyl-prolyl cis-trans isomerase [Aureisphaera galaxeae]|uniref:peptidyl-prolyl cis-trans isomerase n=1 Tax=Aureisphaera galaxeae TaxID=1538023 RepID=UPI00235001A9|nr:peptidyl-prolyl cis-trans isomerase [Aureisphaera galaxeae]MDC8006362.1 peptidyl-prolyl cis-trans isomerase [Aureisphaera galaxeae]
MHRQAVFYVVLIFVVTACDYFKQEDPRTPIARVNDSYLYEEDIEDLISESTSSEDSALLVSSYINRWATQQLLMDQAKINLSDDELAEYDRLIEQYRSDLFTEAYKSNIVSQQLDSVISDREQEAYYEANKENFRLNDELVQLRYIHVAENFGDLADVTEKLQQFEAEDIASLNELSIQFKAYNFNDSIWVKKEAVFKELPIVMESESELLKKSNFAQLQDSLGVYLVKIEDVLYRNDIAPLSFVAPTINQIILNKRKLELIKNLEKDITKDAIKDKKFEIYPYY